MRRWVLLDQVAAWCEGRGGRRRRARVEECASLRAEHAYDALLRDARSKLYPGARGELRWTNAGRTRQVQWEVRANRLWRLGRVFLTCPACGRRTTRIYLASADAHSAACRSCLGLSYASRQENYKDNGPLKDIGLTRRAYAQRLTCLNRTRSRSAARARWAARRSVWTLSRGRDEPRP